MSSRRAWCFAKDLPVTILFFLWGFAYGLLDVLNSHFQTELNITPGMASGLSAAYFGAYFLMPLTISGWILRRYGFRVRSQLFGLILRTWLMMNQGYFHDRSSNPGCWLSSILA